jgi:hypothetical protein
MLVAKTVRVALLTAAVALHGAVLAQDRADPEGLRALRQLRKAAVAARARVAGEKAALEQARVALNQAIAARKALGSVVADAALEELLRKQREVAERLTRLSRELRATQASVLQATQALVDGIDRRLRALGPRARGRSKDAARARAEVRALLAERGRHALGPVGGSCVLPDVRLSPADGPAEARAKAGLLRDAEERCRRRIGRVEKRIAQLQEERKLLQEAADFQEEGEIFDEESRRRIQTRVQSGIAASEGGGQARTAGVPFSGGGAPAPGAPGGVPTTGDTMTGGETSVNVLRQPQVDATLGVRSGSLEDEMADLTRQRLDLSRAAERIRKAYEEISKRARSLENDR